MYDNPLQELIAKRDAEIQAVHSKYAPLFHQLIIDMQKRKFPRLAKYEEKLSFPRLAQYEGEGNE